MSSNNNKDIFFTVESNGKTIEMNYLVQSRKLFIWLDKEQQPKPTVLDVDYENMAKTREDFCQIFNGDGNDPIVKNAWIQFSDGINQCMYEYYKIQKGNRDGNNPNDGGTNAAASNDNDGLTDEYTEALNRASKTIPEDEKLKVELEKEIPDRNYAESVIRTVEKEVKRDNGLVRQILYTGLSTYTFDPLNLAILGPTSEGKTYAATKVMQYFPKEDVWRIGGWSTKVLIRQRGVLINGKGESIQKQVDDLKEKQRNINRATVRLDFTPAKVEEDKPGEPKMSAAEKINMEVGRRKAEVDKELETIMKDASRLIDLTGKILLFLEPPQYELWNLLKPILSHDEVEMRFDYVDRDPSTGIETKNVIVRGWPAVIICSAKDESESKIWPEIQSRFLVTSPNMNQEKVYDVIK